MSDTKPITIHTISGGADVPAKEAVKETIEKAVESTDTKKPRRVKTHVKH